MQSPIRSRRTLRALPVLIAVAGLALGACGDDDESTEDTVTAVTDAPADDDTSDDSTDDAVTTPAADAPADGNTSIDACSLLDLAEVEALLGTPGVSTATDTSLGAADGCRYAAGTTDVPALIIGNAIGIDFETTLSLACDEAPVEVPAAGDGAVECFGALLVPAGEGSLLVSVEDPTDALTDEQEQAAAVAGATGALARLG